MKSLLLAAVFGLTWFAAATIIYLRSTGQDRPRQRLAELVEQRQRVGRLVTLDLKEEGALAAKDVQAAGAPWKEALLENLERYLAGRRSAEQIALRLRRADLKLQVSEYVVIKWVLAIGMGVLGFTATGRVLFFLLGWIGGFWAPSAYVRRRELERIKAFNGQLPDALSIISNSLRSGYSFLQAVDVVSRELPPPISREFGQVIRESRVNIAVEDALLNLTQRISSDDLELVVTAVLIQRQVGGNLSEILDKISATIRDRIRIMGEIRTLTTQGRLSGWIISLLPVALGMILQLVNPEYITPLFRHPLGWFMLATGAIMQVIGLFIIKRIVSVEV